MFNPPILRLTPSGAAQEALSAAEEAISLNPNSIQSDQTSVSTPLTRRPFSIGVARGAAGSAVPVSYEAAFDAAEHLVGQSALTDHVFSIPARAHLDVMRAALRARHPGVDPEVFANITLDDCEFVRQTFLYCWSLPSQEDAVAAYFDCLIHALVCLHGQTLDLRTEHRGRKAKRLPRRVRLSSSDRWAFEVDLPWGQASFHLIRNHVPPALLEKRSEGDDAGYREAARLLAVEVTLDPAKFVDRHGNVLPVRASQWDGRGAINPASLVLDELRWELWWDHILATEPDEVDLHALDELQRPLVAAYFDGKNIRSMHPLNGDDGAFAKLRDQVVEACGLDIAMPFAVARNNKSGRLRDLLTWENCFVPQDSPELQHVSLNRRNCADLHARFAEALDR